MKTLHFKIEYDSNSIKEDSRVYSSIVRYSYNRFLEKKTTTQVYQDVCSKFKLNSHLCNCALREAHSIFKRFKEQPKKFYFGDLKRFIRKLIDKEQFKSSRNLGLFSEGECTQNASFNSNRLFKIDLANNSIIYKRNRTEHVQLLIKEQLKDKRKRLLESIYLAMENRLCPVSFRIKDDNLYISYDEKIVESYRRFKDLKQNRVLGIDLNPNYIGLSILDFKEDNTFQIIHKQVFDLSNLNDTNNKNKIKFELQQIDNDILKLCKHYRVSKLVIEDLNLKKDNRFWSKKLNRLCKNQFRFSQITNHLNTLCNVHGVEFVQVNTAYSSFVGNFIYGSDNCPDMIAASIEIARRGYKKFSKEWFYPTIISIERTKEVLGNQWKKELKLNFTSWKTFFNQIKKLKLKYRFQLDGSKAVLSKNYYKKKTILYCFI